MLKKFRNLSIRGKIVTGFTISNAAMSILLILLIVILSMSKSKYETVYYGYGVASAEVADASTAYESAVAGIQSVAMVDIAALGIEPSAIVGNIAGMQTKMQDDVAALKDKMIQDSAKELYADLKSKVDAVNVSVDAIIAKIGEGDTASAQRMLAANDFTAGNTAVKKAFDALYNELITEGQARIDSIGNNARITIRLSIAVFVVVLGLIILLVRIVSVSMRKPIANMREGAELLAEGDVGAEIIHFYDDEIGELADSLTKMQANIRAQAEIAKEFSEGNLDINIVANGENDLLGNALVTMIDEENRVMGGITEAVTEIKTGAQEVASASQNLAQGSTEQASAIQQITASIEDITERTKVNANDANTANKLVTQAKTDASQSTSKMREMIDAMSDINTSSEDISKIIKVIDDIAFQTNILALNAAVEAARAGAHGRGFAVVADEVRNLAGKSAQAASETAELIADSIAKVQKGSKLAEETATALEAIVSVIDKIVEITNSIAVASNDQANAIAQIDQAIGQVSQVVQTNSATSEQCAAASEELSAQAVKLRNMIGRYKIKQISSSPARTFAAVPETISLPDDDLENTAPPVISLDDGYGKY